MGCWRCDTAAQAAGLDESTLFLPPFPFCNVFAVFPNAKYRPMLPTRTRDGCWRNTDEVSPLAQLKPIKKAHATGLKTKGPLLKGEPIKLQ